MFSVPVISGRYQTSGSEAFRLDSNSYAVMEIITIILFYIIIYIISISDTALALDMNVWWLNLSLNQHCSSNSFRLNCFCSFSHKMTTEDFKKCLEIENVNTHLCLAIKTLCIFLKNTKKWNYLSQPSRLVNHITIERDKHTIYSTPTRKYTTPTERLHINSSENYQLNRNQVFLCWPE